MYKVQIIYFHWDKYPKRTIKKNLTIDEAQKICSDPETSSETCTNYKARKRTELRGPWFYGYTEQ